VIIQRGCEVVNTVELRGRFVALFEARQPAVLARAPGRVNLIGEHTDYNEGFVLPIAMTQATYVLAGPREDRVLRVHSLAKDQTASWSLDDPAPADLPKWAGYVRGVAALLEQRGIRLDGADLLVATELPLGGGVSSSAALEVGAAKALLALADEVIQPAELALLCQRAEHEYVGSPCGIMDQFICLLGRRDTALLLDCRSRQYDHVTFSLEAVSVVIMDTQVKHDIGASEYPTRQQQCRAGVRYFQKIDPSVRALRDVSTEMLSKHASQMDPTVAARCRHVVTENHRVLQAVEALQRGAMHEFGSLMNESHASLRDQYQVSCEELDALVAIASRVEGVYGARMTGGGFGGCAIALVEDSAVDALRAAVAEQYDARYPKPAVVYTTHPADGAECQQL